jgi:hypothetical protein
MVSPIAVLFVHGVEVRDPRYAEAAIGRLRREFAKRADGREGADRALVIEPAYWIPAVADHENRVFERTFEAKTRPYFRVLDRLVAKVDAGSLLALVPLGAAGALPLVPGIGSLHYPTLRWAVTYFLGDAVAYQLTSQQTGKEGRVVYDKIHQRIDMALHSLAKRAGPDAPLCVIAHSLGTVIASDHIWDCQHSSPRRSQGNSTSLERCETLAFFYTLGSPIALWTLRFASGGEPIAFPSRGLATRYPELRPAWVNFYDRDDVIGYPLRGLNDKYREVVTEDRAVAVGPRLVRNTPVAHPWYWNDSSVMGPIGAALADAWVGLQQAAGGDGRVRRPAKGRPALVPGSRAGSKPSPRQEARR